MWGGIVSGRVTTLAAALETTADEFLCAVERSDVTPMVDTAEQNDRKQRNRSTDPAKRCLAFTTEAFAELRETIDAEAPDTVPA